MLAFAGFYRSTEAGQADEPFSSDRMAPSDLLTHAVEPNGRLASCRRVEFLSGVRGHRGVASAVRRLLTARYPNAPLLSGEPAHRSVGNDERRRGYTFSQAARYC